MFMLALRRRHLLLGALAAAIAFGARADYPDKQITFVVPFAAGSATDQLPGPNKSNPRALKDLLGGQISMMTTDMAAGLPQGKGGKVRALGVSTLKRSPLPPDVPTISEAGLKGYDRAFWFAAYVPANT